MHAGAIVVAVGLCGAAVAGCGTSAARDPAATPAALRTPAAPVALATAPGPCRVVVARTLEAVADRIDARAALHRSVVGRAPLLVGALTRPTPPTCAATSAQTVADTVGAVAVRLVRAERSGPAVTRALRIVSRDRRFVRAVRRRDPAALRAAIVRFFRVRALHIVRVRATTTRGRLVGDVGGPFVLAPASRAVRSPGGRVVGRVTLSVQDDAGFIKLMRRFTGAGVVLRSAGRLVPGSSAAPAAGAIPERGTVSVGARRYATFSFATRAFPDRRLDVALLVPLARAS
jgi:hypothetical protein